MDCVASLLEQAKALGLELAVAGDMLEINGPKTTDAEQIAKQIAARKPDVIAALNGEPTDADVRSTLYVDGVDAYEQLLTYKPPKPLKTADAMLNPDLASIAITPGEITLVGGAPGSGKTGLIYQLVFDAMRADDNLKALSINVEMTYFDLLLRQLSRLSGVPLSSLRDGTVKILDRSLRDARAELHRINPRIDYMRPPYAMPRILEAVEQTEAGVLILDYVQRIRVPGYSDKRHEMDASVELLRRVADTGVAIVCLSSLSRSKSAGGTGYDNSQQIGNFKETGEFEFGVENCYLMRTEPGAVADCHLRNPKRRHGEKRDVTLEVDFTLQRFRDKPGGVAMPLDEFA